VISPARVSFTVEAWIKTTIDYQNGACTSCPTQVVVSHFNPNLSGGVNDGGYELWVTNKGKVKFALIRNASTSTTVTNPSSILPNRWYHVAGVYNVTDPDNLNQPTVSLYVQGARVEMNTTPIPSRTSTSGQPFMIGRENIGVATYFFNGKIDEVRFSLEAVYAGASYVFPGGSIEQAWGHLGNLVTTKGLWKFDNQDGRDVSGNNNNGALQGNPLFVSDVPGGQSPPISLNFWQRPAFANLLLAWIVGGEHYASAANEGPGRIAGWDLRSP